VFERGRSDWRGSVQLTCRDDDLTVSRVIADGVFGKGWWLSGAPDRSARCTAKVDDKLRSRYGGDMVASLTLLAGGMVWQSMCALLSIGF